MAHLERTNLNDTPSAGPLSSKELDKKYPPTSGELKLFFGVLIAGLVSLCLLALWGVVA